MIQWLYWLIHLTVSALVGFIIGQWAWNKIVIPFSNPLEVMGPLVEAQFSPLNNLLRFSFFVFAPSFVFLISLLARPLRDLYFRYSPHFSVPSNFKKFSPDPAWVRVLEISTYLMLGCFCVSGFLSFLNSSFGFNCLDFFHAGELLTPAYNYWVSHKIWSGSYFVHGAFYDPLLSVLGWKALGNQTIGASQIAHAFFASCVPLGLAGFIWVSGWSLRFRGRLASLMMIHGLLWGWFFTFGKSQTLVDRDLPVLFGMSSLIFGLISSRPIFLFFSGIFSSISFFYSIDRGAYYLVTWILALVFYLGIVFQWDSFRVSFRREAYKILSYSLAGFFLGWLGFFLWVGPTEFQSFLSNTWMLFRTKDLFDSYIYPIPELNHLKNHTLLPIVLIGVQILGFGATFLVFYRKRNRPIKGNLALQSKIYPTAAVVHFIFVCLSFCYFRGALGRSDFGHVLYSSAFAFLGFVFLMGGVLCLLSAKVKWLPWVLVFLMSYNFQKLIKVYSSLEPKQILTAYQKIQTLASASDDKFLPPEELKKLEKLKKIFQDEPCFFSLTSEAALPYLLKKPSCGKFFIVWFASPKPLREQILKDLSIYSPKYILFSSSRWTINIDGISNEKRMPDVHSYVQTHYEPYQNIADWQIYRRR